MPYIPPHLRPGFIHKKAKTPSPKKKGVHFPTDLESATNITTNIAEDIGIKYSPHRDSKPKKKAIRSVLNMIEVNNVPLAIPTNNVEALPIKFRNMLKIHGFTLKNSPKRKTQKNAKDRKLKGGKVEGGKSEGKKIDV